jgi:recombinase
MAWIQRSRDQYFVCWREGGRRSPKKVQAAGTRLGDARRMRDMIAGRVREGRIGGGVIAQRITVREFADGWIAGRNIRPKSLEREEYIVKNHLRVYGETPFGFKRIGDRLEPLERELAGVRRIYGLRRDGLTLRAIANTLNRDRIRTKKGKRWAAEQIRYVLGNELYRPYVGEIGQGGKEAKQSRARDSENDGPQTSPRGPAVR